MDVRVVIGDENATSIDKIRRGYKKVIYTFADRNHLKKISLKIV